MRPTYPLLFASMLIACGPSGSPAEGTDAGSQGDDAGSGSGSDGGVGPGGCPASYAGAACVIALHDEAIDGCDAAVVAKLRGELDMRAEMGPLWAGGRALFRTDGSVAVAGGFNNWLTTELQTRAVCGTDLFAAVGAVESGYWQYKLESVGTWMLDPHNPAFAYDDFAGNADGKNSVLNTPDSGRGHVMRLDRACSAALSNCRDVTAYVPPGYASPANASVTYPVLFMHDGQNVWSDHDCCFGHTGWEIDTTLDAEIAANRVAPLIVIAAEHSNARNNEYGLSPQAMEAFMQFQVDELQPAALAQVRWNQQRVAVAGSSLGGLVSMHLALSYPQTFGAVASLSGAFWPLQDTDQALRDRLPAYGKQPLAVYIDHGGNVGANSDGAADSVEVRDMMIGLGWQRSDSPSCTPSETTLCYFNEPGATHDELAWKARAWRFLRYLFPSV
jgi:predicted alpha/beta superfamily hydrolase